MDFHQKHQDQDQVVTAVSSNETMHRRCSSVKKTFCSLVRLGLLNLDDHYLVDYSTFQNSLFWFVWDEKNVDNFPAFFLVILVFHQATHCQGF